MLSQCTPPPRRPPCPVSIAKAERQDVPVWLCGIGTVQALNTVPVRARVDGTLMQVPVTEGKLIKQGTLLAVIDPRPYQAVLDQATAKKAQDEAQLANAKLDLQRFSSLAKQRFASRQQVDTQTAKVRSVHRGAGGRRRLHRGGAAQSRASATSPRRSTAASGCARSIPATWCTPRPRGS